MGRGDTTGDIRNGASGIDKGDVKVMKEEKVGKIVDKVPAVELETAEEANKLCSLGASPSIQGYVI